MAKCHECDSDVALNDVFCPFCGISLQPIVAVEPDESMESTIMMPPAEVAKMVEAEVADADASAGPDESGIESGPADFEVSQPPATITGLSEQPGEIDSIPAPQILSHVPPTSDNILAKSTSGFRIKEVIAADAVDTSDTDDTKEETPISDDDFFAAPAEPAPLESVPESPEPKPFSPFDIAGDRPVSATEEENIPTLEEVPISESTDLSGFGSGLRPDVYKPHEPEAVQQPPAVEPPPREDSGIAMPKEELTQHDPFAGSSMFDSVRIMESEVPAAPDEIATRLGPLIRDSGNVKQKEPAAVAASEPRSHTAQNIGEGDTDNKRAAKLKPLSEGTILNGRYEIIRKIGGGGMGAVYLASDNNLGGVLRAVKEMVQAHIEDEQQEKAINDFKRESMILSSLDHLSIPTIFDYFYDEIESRFYLVMKYISGGDLASRLRSAPEGRIDEKQVTEWAIQIIDVLDYLHNQPSTIVYRDLKPSNIMIDGNSGRVMLIDFGIARSISQKEEKGVTAVGTMGYAPPELFSGNVEPRSDIYSLGSTMFHLLTGADPQSNPLLIFDFQKNPRPRQINPRLSDQMEKILMRSVEYSADSRFSSAAEMRQVLEDHLKNLVSGNLTFGVSEAPAAVSLANQTVFCGFCGQRIVATDLFCAFCGSKQPIAQHGVQSAGVYAKPSLTAKLIIEGTNELSAPVFSLQKDENLVGRRDPMSNIFPEVDLSKYDPQTKISRRHARIWREGTNYLVEDLGSSNGTVLAPSVKEAFRLMPHRPHPLVNGDKIKVGDTTLHFMIG
jgi:serine/threonine-protein kinase